ncbi:MULTISPECIES: DUF4097 family beta strand repeat-containing protein [Lactobacillus]|uniref:DUF4097 domain-containing protein n=1 Tax=Lactobacillus melliventris TaxID=1218507 RepID=A0A0F4LLQ5_9LACO|nr:MULTISPECIES: DUF4097 family beta strand repeat-containing protein [Lactobacillus]KJY58481.1 hypothetical protein JF74_01500 [Lactobacillus melliventris]PXY86098.1 hypothetical protein DK873_00685 [Lactobacillus melliventris]RMC62239.1 hypothetical protein F5ESL0259_00610 [Lactobacillus sp. ESL0259]
MKIHIGGDFDQEFETHDEKVESQEIDLENFSNIDVEIAASGVSVQVGSDFHISTYDINPDRIKIRVVEKTLFIRARKPHFNKKVYIRKIKPKITITIPQAAELNEVQIIDFAGNIDLAGFNMQKLDVRANAGSLKLQDIMIQNKAEMVLDAGSLYINHCKMNSNANLAAGTIRVTSLQGKNHFNLAAGSLKMIDDEEHKTDYDLFATLGSIYFHGNRMGKHFYKHEGSANQLTAISSVGSIKIQ